MLPTEHWEEDDLNPSSISQVKGMQIKRGNDARVATSPGFRGEYIRETTRDVAWELAANLGEVFRNSSASTRHSLPIVELMAAVRTSLR